MQNCRALISTRNRAGEEFILDSRNANITRIQETEITDLKMGS